MKQQVLAVLLLTSSGLGIPSISACGAKKSGPKPVSSAAASGAKAPSNIDPNVDGKVDAALLKQLTDIAHVCKVDVAAGNVSCPQGENRQLISEFVADQRSRVRAIATLARGLLDEDPAVQTVTANVMNGAFRSPWGDVKSPVAGAEANALLAAALKAPKPIARQAVPGAVLAATLANQIEQLFKALDNTDETELRPLGYRYVMTHGRLATFGKVQQLVKGTDSALSFAALEAPHNMYGWTATEKASICPWAADLLNDPRPNVATRAAGLLSNCSGEIVDQLLSRGEKALRDGTFDTGQLGAFRDLCSPANQRAGAGASEKQCSRNRELLKAVVELKKLGSQTRSMALVSLAYQWPDDKTLKLAQSLKKDSDKSVAEHADRTVKRLEQHQGIEQHANKAAKKSMPANR